MKAPAIPANEDERLARLRGYEVLDSPPEPEFDDLTQLAAQICQTPIAAISLIDESRQWFKSKCGLSASETPRDVSFCGHALLGDGTFVIPDALKDERFADNPLVTGGPKIRFYAGSPLKTDDGLNLGSLCVIDSVPRVLGDDQLRALERLARQVVNQLELRRALGEREQNQIALRATLSFQDALLNEAGYVIVGTDRDGVIITFNRTAELQLGYTAAEVVGAQSLARILDPDEMRRRAEELSKETGARVEPGFEALVASVEAGGSEEREWTFRCKDGSQFPALLCVSAIREEGRVTGYVGIARDISAQKATMDDLAGSEMLKSAIVESALDCIVSMDDRGRIMEFNPAAEATFGYRRADVIGEEMAAMIIPPSLREQHRRGLRHFLESGEGPVIGKRFETNGMRSDGTEFPVELAITTLTHHGRSTFTAYLRDITVRQRQEEAMRQAKDASDHANMELARVNRLKDEFLANMSHELRTPLNAILGMSEALSEQVYGGLNADQVGALKVIYESGSHLLELINDVLDLSKVEAGRMEIQFTDVEPADACQTAYRFMKEVAGRKGIALTVSVPGDLPPIHADLRRMKQILVNLLSNAVKFTPEGGSVGVEARHCPLTNTVDFIISDTGIGIPEEQIPLMFERFVQVDAGLNRRSEGTGLGLALVWKLTELHGGNITVESRPGDGTRISVKIPVSQGAGSATDGAESAEAPFSEEFQAGDCDILLAEDTENSIATFQGYLTARGFRVRVAQDGLQAIESCHVARPKLILMDIQMPLLDGLETIRRLRASAELREIPILALSGLVMPGDRERCLAAGADDYLAKPVNLKQLVERMRALLSDRC